MTPPSIPVKHLCRLHPPARSKPRDSTNLAFKIRSEITVPAGRRQDTHDRVVNDFWAKVPFDLPTLQRWQMFTINLLLEPAPENWTAYRKLDCPQKT